MAELTTHDMTRLIEEALVVPMLWDQGSRVHNWRNHVGEHTMVVWRTFTDVQKIAIAVDAEDRASDENWEW